MHKSDCIILRSLSYLKWTTWILVVKLSSFLKQEVCDGVKELSSIWWGFPMPVPPILSIISGKKPRPAILQPQRNRERCPCPFPTALMWYAATSKPICAHKGCTEQQQLPVWSWRSAAKEQLPNSEDGARVKWTRGIVKCAWVWKSVRTFVHV